MKGLRTVVLSSLIIAFASLAAGAQEARLRGSLDAETLANVTKLTDSARAESLPVDPLIGVALEGAQRHAPGGRIVGAVRDYLKALRGSRSALGNDAAPSEIVSGAGALLSAASHSRRGDETSLDRFARGARGPHRARSPEGHGGEGDRNRRACKCP